MKPQTGTNQISGWVHWTAVAVWIIFSAASIGLFAAGVFPSYLENVWTAAMMYPSDLQGMGVSVIFYAAFQTALDVLLAAAFFGIGIVIFTQGHNDWMMILVSLTCISFGMLFVPTLDVTAASYPAWAIPVAVIRGTGLALSIIAGFYLMPDGRFVPKITRWLALVWLTLVIAWVLFPSLPANLVYISTWSDNLALSFTIYGLWYLSGVAAQVYRYKRVSRPVQQQQTKWVVLGTSAAVAAFFFFNMPLIFFPQLDRPGYAHLLYNFFARPAYIMVTAFVPASMAISILKYRLWEVDRIINRSLVYGILTLILGVAYIIMVLVLRTSLVSFTDNPSTITTILSTLAVAAMFHPVRKFLQAWIDRQFFRRKYDAQMTLEQFRISIRNKVDIGSLSNELIRLVDKTIQPETISLWLVVRNEDEVEPKQAVKQAGR